jgi:hypothetical protein
MAKVTSLNFFPFCPQVITDTSLIGNGTSHPLGLTLQEMMYLYWKVKTIKFESSETLNVSNSVYNTVAPFIFLTDPASYAGTYSRSDTFVRQNTPVSEIDLICNPNPFLYSFTDDLSAIVITIDFSQVYEVAGNPNLYYPSIIVSSEFHASNGGDLSGLNAINAALEYLGWPLITYTDNGGSCSINLFGTSAKTIPLYLTGIVQYGYQPIYGGFAYGPPFFYASNDDASLYASYSFDSSVSTSIAISVQDTWPYNP